MLLDSGTIGIEGDGLTCVLKPLFKLSFSFFELNISERLIELGLVMFVDGFIDDLSCYTFTDS